MLGIPSEAVQLGLDDMTAAYRQVPVNYIIRSSDRWVWPRARSARRGGIRGSLVGFFNRKPPEQFSHGA